MKLIQKFFKDKKGYLMQIFIALIAMGALTYLVMTNYSESIETRSNSLKTDIESTWVPEPMTVD